jgi:prevent-host-death family protein
MYYISRMKEVTLREANQQFSQLVREVEETGEAIMVLRNGKKSVKISPAEEKPRKRTLTREQEIALNSFLEFARTSPGKSDGPWTREELYER